MTYEKSLERLNQLIELGKVVLSTRHSPPPGIITKDYVNDDPFYQWKAGSLSFLKNVFGEDSTHFQGFQESCRYASYPLALQGQSILKAAKEDLEGGYLKKLETLVSADIFTNLLEMAEYLVEQGYKDPAASLIGAVLENGLKQIARNHDIKVKNREDIGALNSKLADAQIYNRLMQKRVQVWNDIRNNADHGNFSEYSLDFVKDVKRCNRFLRTKSVSHDARRDLILQLLPFLSYTPPVPGSTPLTSFAPSCSMSPSPS